MINNYLNLLDCEIAVFDSDAIFQVYSNSHCAIVDGPPRARKRRDGEPLVYMSERFFKRVKEIRNVSKDKVIAKREEPTDELLWYTEIYYIKVGKKYWTGKTLKKSPRDALGMNKPQFQFEKVKRKYKHLDLPIYIENIKYFGAKTD